MNTELFIENYSVDITKEVSALMTFSIDDVKDFSSRSTTWSKTIVLPGTAKNNRAFGHVFQIGRSNSFNTNLPNVNFNFNASKSANVILFQDHMQTFKGVLRLLQINYTNGFAGKVEYEVNLSGNISALNSKLTGALLEDLDFSSLRQEYSIANIINSWNLPQGSGIYYPLIDYGNCSVDKHNWSYKAFRPALYLKEYIDKIFPNAGYRYDCPLFQTTRFKSIVIPHNQKELRVNATTIAEGLGVTQQPIISATNDVDQIPRQSVSFGAFTGSAFAMAISDDALLPGLNSLLVYTDTPTVTLKLQWNFSGTYRTQDNVLFYIMKNGVSIVTGTLTTLPPTETAFNSPQPAQPFTISGSVNTSFQTGDEFEFLFEKESSLVYDYIVTITSASFTVTSTNNIQVPINLGQFYNINDCIPRNIRQIDLLVGIVKLWNLYVYEDKNDPYLINIKPYIDYYSKNTSNAVDWTMKLDRSKPIKAKPMSEINAKIYKFKFKSDSDFYNDLYRKRYNEGYGDRIYDTQFEFSSQVIEPEILFSATPIIGYNGEDKKYSTIFKRTGTDPDAKEENVDSNIRILQTKRINSAANWNIMDGATVLQTLGYYGYAGHFDDPNTPTNDLNFGATKELFFQLSNIGNLGNTQFNVYWSLYMAEVTDKDSKLISAYFKLSPTDILNLDFSKYVYIEGISFRLNQIKDYNASKPDVCIVELLKVSSASYSETAPPSGPPNGCFLLWSDANTLDWTNSNELAYSDCTDNPGDGGGGGPDPVIYKLDWSFVKTNLFGVFRIYVNNVLFDWSTTNGDSGLINLTTGDIIKIEVTGTFNKPKRIFVSNNVDGIVSDTTTSAIVTKSYTFTVLANRNYTVIGESKNS